MTRFLETLASSPAYRGELVETLRASASMLDGSAPALPEDIRTRCALELAARLLAVAAELCDHGRIGPDGRCRYCESVIDRAEGVTT